MAPSFILLILFFASPVVAQYPEQEITVFHPFEPTPYDALKKLGSDFEQTSWCLLVVSKDD